MRGYLKMCACAVGVAALAGTAFASPVGVRWESEMPGMQHTSATFTAGGEVETFDSQPTGLGDTFTTDFGSSGDYSGTYERVQINTADQYGGAGGVGNYAVAFDSDPYTLDLSASKDPVTYFGYWLSALDAGNQVQFYGKLSPTSSETLLFTFTPKNVIDSIGATKTPSAYYGNPNANFDGQDGGEPFVFVDFFAASGVTFDKIVFAEVNSGGGYESDNHTVGEWLTQSTGTSVPVPEPAAWALMLAGFGFCGAAIRFRARRRAGPSDALRDLPIQG